MKYMQAPNSKVVAKVNEREVPLLSSRGWVVVRPQADHITLKRFYRI